MKDLNTRFKPLKGVPARAVRRVEDFIIENGEVQGESEADGVGRGELDHGDVARCFVSDQTVLGRLLPVVARGELCQVPVVISLPEQGTQKVTRISFHQRAGGGQVSTNSLKPSLYGEENA